jgi:hypothetical protein
MATVAKPPPLSMVVMIDCPPMVAKVFAAMKFVAPLIIEGPIFGAQLRFSPQGVRISGQGNLFG